MPTFNAQTLRSGIAGMLFVLLVGAIPGTAQEFDTLRSYSPTSPYWRFRTANVTAQAARFDLASPIELHSVIVTLGGPANGSAVVRLFGHEGGLPAPGLEHDITRPQTIRKSRKGVERIVVPMPGNLPVASTQLYVVIEKLSAGTYLVSDREMKRPACVAASDVFQHQALRSAGRWSWAPYSFCIDLVARPEARAQRDGFEVAGAEFGLPDTAVGAGSIAWSDIDRDGFNELLVAGRLYRNNGGTSFTDITAAAGLDATRADGLFIDADRDGRADVMLFGAEGDSAITLFLNNGDRTFRRMRQGALRVGPPTALAAADADGDGFVDVFVGQTNGGVLLLNEHGRGFRDGTMMLASEDSVQRSRVTGAQWTDADGDGDLDLFTVTGDGDALLLRGDQGFANGILGASLTVRPVERAGCHWADYDNDGQADLLLPRPLAIEDVRSSTRQGGAGPVLRSVRGGARSRVDGGIVYDDERSGGAWGDVDNDGRMDLILTTACGCRYASLYTQKAPGGFTDRTFALSLERVSAGPDALFVDFDNDGRQDIATFVDGRFVLLRNVSSAGNAAVLQLNGDHAIGATVEAFAGGERMVRFLESGHGAMMQTAPQIHIGLGAQQAIDSARITWANGRTQMLGRLGAGSHRIDERPDAGSVLLANATARPNPATDAVTIAFELGGAAEVTLQIYASDGRLVHAENISAIAGRNEAVWDLAQSGVKVPQGSYVFRVRAAGAEVAGRFVVQR